MNISLYPAYQSALYSCPCQRAVSGSACGTVPGRASGGRTRPGWGEGPSFILSLSASASGSGGNAGAYMTQGSAVDRGISGYSGYSGYSGGNSYDGMAGEYSGLARVKGQEQAYQTSRRNRELYRSLEEEERYEARQIRQLQRRLEEEAGDEESRGDSASGTGMNTMTMGWTGGTAASEGRFSVRGASEDEDKKDKGLTREYRYNYKEVSNKIRRAKTVVGADQALISARRKVSEIKRKILSGAGDAKKLQFALTHARRMEMAARKKKHHLELEELVTTTRKRDERLKSQEEAASDLKGAVTQLQEAEITEREDAVFDRRDEALDEAYERLEQMKGREEEEKQEMLAQFNARIAELGEEELKELEEQMELLECMEIVNPHMSQEELEKLKRRHRDSEEKAMLKADMDYLKSMIKYIYGQEAGGNVRSAAAAASVYSQAVSAAGGAATAAAAPAAAAAVPAAAAIPSDCGSIDMQV